MSSKTKIVEKQKDPMTMPEQSAASENARRASSRDVTLCWRLYIGRMTMQHMLNTASRHVYLNKI